MEILKQEQAVRFTEFSVTFWVWLAMYILNNVFIYIIQVFYKPDKSPVDFLPAL